MQYKIEGLDCGTVLLNDPDNKISGGSGKLGYMEGVDENGNTMTRFIFDLPEKGTLITNMLPEIFKEDSQGSYGYVNIKLENATAVGNYACKDMPALCKVHLPNAVSIGESAFENCNNLGVIECPECLSIGANAFKGTSSSFSYHLWEVNFNKVQSIGANAFENSYFGYENEQGYTTIQFPEVRTIGAEAFKRVSDLGEVSFPKVESIGNDAFKDMSTYDSDRKITISLPSSRREQFEPNLSTYGIDTEKHIVNWV